METRRQSRFGLVRTVLRGNRAQDDNHGGGVVEIFLFRPLLPGLLGISNLFAYVSSYHSLESAQIKITTIPILMLKHIRVLR